MAVKALIGGMLAVLLTVFLVFNVVMPAMTIIAILITGLVRGWAVSIPANLVIPVVASVAILGFVYRFWKRR